MNIAENLSAFRKKIPDHVKLVAVSKTKPNELIMEAYNSGHKIFGENKVQDQAKKAAELPENIEWHFIGHLQTNKVKYIAPFVSLIHAVDSLKLLKVIDKEANRSDRIIDCLLQFHIATEESKFGLSLEESKQLLSHPDYSSLNNIRIVGLMGMASYTNDTAQVRKEFASLADHFKQLKAEFFSKDEWFRELSMGMSADYQIAIEEGSTIVRVGSTIFGARN